MKKEIPVLFRDAAECCGCGACQSICPARAITMKLDARGFLYPELDSEKCVCCYLCGQVCPWKEEAEKEENQ